MGCFLTGFPPHIDPAPIFIHTGLMPVGREHNVLTVPQHTTALSRLVGSAWPDERIEHKELPGDPAYRKARCKRSSFGTEALTADDDVSLSGKCTPLIRCVRASLGSSDHGLMVQRFIRQAPSSHITFLAAHRRFERPGGRKIPSSPPVGG